jgi:hypothetical protein
MTPTASTADLASPHFDPWRLIRQPGTSHDGWTEWTQLDPTRTRVTATDDYGTERSWIVTITEENPR